MTNDEKLDLITRNLEEVLTEEELKALISSNTPLKHYIGFEISGKLHIGHFYQLMKVKDLQEAGAETVIWLADYHSAVNDKLGGDIDTIKKVAKEYFVPAMKVLFECIGGNPDKLIFKLCSEEYAAHPNFWMTFLEVAKNTSLSRSKRSITIMGREEAEDSIETAKIIYPIMQAADIFLLQVNIAQAGIDQRKVHVVARDAAKQIKPVAIHTPILLSLSHPAQYLREGEGLSIGTDSSSGTNKSTNLISLTDKSDEDSRDIAAMRTKMSKSKADSAVSIHDSAEDIRLKLNKAYASEGDIMFNPVLNWTRHLIFNQPDSSLVINRDKKFGGNITYTSYDNLEKDYEQKKLHPMDLKNAVAEWLIIKLEPVRDYFKDPQNSSALEEIEKLKIH